MSLGHGSRPVRDGLIFHMDLQNTKRSFKGKPTTNLVSNNPMILADDRSTPITVLGNNSNMCQGWGMSVYPNSNVSAETGAEWDPDVLDPLGDRGAWKMIMRPGGNSETQIYSGQGIITDQTKDYTISVWCKTQTASTFRIHLNVTKDGASNWGHASGYHSGSDQWEKLTFTIPANSGVTRINILRCQGIGTTKTAEAYFKYFQVEQNSFATRFVNGQRLDTASIVDLTKNKNVINAANMTYTEGNAPTFDGTDDALIVEPPPEIFSNQWTHELWVKFNGSSNTYEGLVWAEGAVKSGFSSYQFLLSVYNRSYFHFRINNSTTGWTYTNSPTINVDLSEYNHVTWSFDNGVTKIYINGTLFHTDTSRGSYSGGSDSELYVGSRNDNAYKLQGELPSLKVYNRALTADEVKKNFASSRGRYGI